jgi:DNA-binding transcriptional ArsR family regulator
MDVTTDPLSATLFALADPTRRAILARLAEGEATVGELGKPFAITPPAVTKHLKVLREAGLVTQGRKAQFRPCRIDPRPLRDVSVWIEAYRKLWDQRLDRLEDYLREVQRLKARARRK